MFVWFAGRYYIDFNVFVWFAGRYYIDFNVNLSEPITSRLNGTSMRKIQISEIYSASRD